MYAAAMKSRKEKKSRAVANTVGQKKKNNQLRSMLVDNRQGSGFVDNRAEPIDRNNILKSEPSQKSDAQKEKQRLTNDTTKNAVMSEDGAHQIIKSQGGTSVIQKTSQMRSVEVIQKYNFKQGINENKKNFYKRVEGLINNYYLQIDFQNQHISKHYKSSTEKNKTKFIYDDFGKVRGLIRYGMQNGSIKEIKGRGIKLEYTYSMVIGTANEKTIRILIVTTNMTNYKDWGNATVMTAFPI
jgi:hypothetical protein